MSDKIPKPSDDPEMDAFKASLGPAGEIMTPKMLEEALLIASVSKKRERIASVSQPADTFEEDPK